MVETTADLVNVYQKIPSFNSASLSHMYIAFAIAIHITTV